MGGKVEGSLNVLCGEERICLEKLFGPITSGDRLDDHIYGQASARDDRLAQHQPGIDSDSIHSIHVPILTLFSECSSLFGIIGVGEGNLECRPTAPDNFGFAVGLWPTRRTVACGRLMASSFR